MALGITNTYANLTEVKASLGITGTADDARLLRIIEAASRAIDRYCGRFFYAKTATLYFDPPTEKTWPLPDLLSVTTFKVDDDEDGTFETTWVENTDFYLEPYDSSLEPFPKWRFCIHPDTTKTFPNQKRTVEIAAVWGFGDGQSASPYIDTGVTVTVGDATTTTITTSADTLSVGDTILAGSEQMFVEVVGTGDITAVRGVNGTTASDHSAAAASRAQYPPDITTFANYLTGEKFNDAKRAGVQSERIGNYSYRLLTDEAGQRSSFWSAAVGNYRRGEVYV